ncbi:MAG: MerR family transcriptional regulator [Deltaproteobacteria bacterium]|nr:MerR family transcriptional regulator [Deltaproteobacteria bacterium]
MRKDFANLPIPDRMYFKIGEVCKITGIQPYVLRYWETEFDLITPEKSNANQRVYQRKDIENILLIKQLLWGERYSIEGARQKLKELKREQRSKRLSESKSEANVKLTKIKQELKELVRFIRSN